MIRDSFFNQEFEPGRIKMPTESPSGTPPNVRLFLSTNKKLYARHHDMLWSENTWVIGRGKAGPADDFLRLPDTVCDKIKHVKLILSLSDVSTTPIDEWFQKNNITTSGPPCDYIEVLQLFRNSYARLNQQLQSIWYSKLRPSITSSLPS